MSTPAFTSPKLTACDDDHAVTVTGGSRTVVDPAADYAPGRPPIFGDADLWDALETRLPDVLPATRVLDLPQARVVGPHAWVVTPDDRVVVSLSWYETFGRPSISQIGWDEQRHLPGTLLNLGTMNGSINYAHSLLDGLGRLALSEAVGIAAADVDHVVVPGFAADSTVLDDLAIPRSKVLTLERGQSVTADRVVAPSMPGTTRIYRRTVCDLFRRSRHVEGVADGGRRVMLVRRSSRRGLSNVEQVEQVAQDHGFELVSPDQVDLPAVLAEAGTVLGEHGAAMADLAYCRPGTRVVEMMPSDHLFPYWFSLARAGDLPYAAVIGASEEVRDPATWGSSPFAFTVAPDDLAAALAHAAAT